METKSKSTESANICFCKLPRKGGNILMCLGHDDANKKHPCPGNGKYHAECYKLTDFEVKEIQHFFCISCSLQLKQSTQFVSPKTTRLSAIRIREKIRINDPYLEKIVNSEYKNPWKENETTTTDSVDKHSDHVTKPLVISEETLLGKKENDHDGDEDRQKREIREKREYERMQILLGYKLKSQTNPNELLKPIELNKYPKYNIKNKGPTSTDFNSKLVEIKDCKFSSKILFYCECISNNGELIEDWLDIIIVSKLEPHSMFIDFISRIYLFRRGSFRHLLNRAKLLDKRDGTNLQELINVIPVECIKAKIKANKEADKASLKRTRTRSKQNIGRNKKFR